MRIQRYGIELETMHAEHLEMIRLWRNQDYIRKRMQFQEILSSEDQLAWFNALDAERNLYWVIRSNGYPIGLVHIKDMDDDFRSGEAGVFVGEPNFLDSAQPILAILVMMEIAFYVIGLKQLNAKIHHENHKAIRFNNDLGYRLQNGQEPGFQYYFVGFQDFENATSVLRSKAVRMFGDSTGVGLSSDSVWVRKFRNMSATAQQYLKPQNTIN